MRSGSGVSIWKIILIIFGALILLNVYNCSQTNKYKDRLASIKILSTENDTLFYDTAANFTDGELLFTKSYINLTYDHQSPFRDGKSLEELIDEYLRNRYQDHYGTNRRTGKCKRIHEAIDLFVPENTPVYPVGKIGIVMEVSHNPNYLKKVACLRNENPADSVLVEYGKIVRVLYPEGYQTIYAHLNEVDVEENQIVYSTTKLGVTGVTGNLVRSGKASHLHMELRDSEGNSFDPRERLFYDRQNIDAFLNLLKFEPEKEQ